MANTIEQYREAKATYQRLHNQAKKELIARFNQLAAEVLHIQRELKEDFGHKITIPVKAKSVRGPRTPASKEPDPAALNPKVVALGNRLAAQKKKLEAAVAGSKPDKALKDRIYELEDELRLAKEQ